MNSNHSQPTEHQNHSSWSIGVDAGTFGIKAVLTRAGESVAQAEEQTRGKASQAVAAALTRLLPHCSGDTVWFGYSGANADVLTPLANQKPAPEIEAVQAGIVEASPLPCAVLSLGHENMYYIELDDEGTVTFFNRNGQCAAGSGAFWHQQATRLGYDAASLAQMACQARNPVQISGRCAVFAKSDMTHAINDGATHAQVALGMAEALVEMILTQVAKNRLTAGIERLVVIGGVAENQAVMQYLTNHCEQQGITLTVPDGHAFLQALGGAKTAPASGVLLPLAQLQTFQQAPPAAAGHSSRFILPPLPRERVQYLEVKQPDTAELDLTEVYLGVDCGSVSTKCALLDKHGRRIGGIYLPTKGRPALQVLALMDAVKEQYPQLKQSTITACTTGSGRFLSQRILGAEYAVDEITCQAEGIKAVLGSDDTFAVIEIGGEDSKYLQLRRGVLYDYCMNPVCAAGTGTFLENLAELFGVQIKGEFSEYAFQGRAPLDLGDRCTLLAQSALTKAAAHGLELPDQLASLAYSSAKNYISRTTENRPLEGTVVFTGATAKNHALAAAFAQELDREVLVPPEPELTGAFGAAVMARNLAVNDEPSSYQFLGLDQLQGYDRKTRTCTAECVYNHSCDLDIISFPDGRRFIYGDRCGRYSLPARTAASDLPDYMSKRRELFEAAAASADAKKPEQTKEQPRIGIAQAGLYFELYPFWNAFFANLGAAVVVSPQTSEAIVHEGKNRLEADMCFPMKVLVGHYAALAREPVDFIFLPEVVSMEPLPWAANWPKEFTCPLMQTIRRVVQNSLDLDDTRVLYAQLDLRDGAKRILHQLRPTAEQLLGRTISKQELAGAVEAGYAALAQVETAMETQAVEMFAALPGSAQVCAVVLGRSYTVYDTMVAKDCFRAAAEQGILAIPQDYILSYMRGWLAGRISTPFLPPPEAFREQITHYMDDMDNMYPIQLQKMLSVALFLRYYNENRDPSMPPLRMILQDPFKCGPNSFLRHYLNGVGEYLRLTLDEHTAPAGMITRLEAFRNTCLFRGAFTPGESHSSRTVSALTLKQKTILVPQPTHHADVFAAVFRSFGVNSEVLPRSSDPDLRLARAYINGDECLPMAQNMQDFLAFLTENPDRSREELLFFQGAACGPCRYGLYAPTQALLLNKAGYGAERVCSVKLDDVMRAFGFTFAVAVFDGMVAMDCLYKMLYAVRPYEVEPGTTDTVFATYVQRLTDHLSRHRFSLAKVPSGRYLQPLIHLLEQAAAAFAAVDTRSEMRPRILVAGEFYVRLDDRANQDIFRKIEEAGGEVSLSPASELFAFTNYIHLQEQRETLAWDKRWPHYGRYASTFAAHWLVQRDEHRLEEACRPILAEGEPSPAAIAAAAADYVSPHYGGEPPMTVGRILNFAQRERVAGAIVVAPFTCMPGSVVEAQLRRLRLDSGLPIAALDYDGREDANREELIEGLVFQARQRLALSAAAES